VSGTAPAGRATRALDDATAGLRRRWQELAVRERRLLGLALLLLLATAVYLAGVQPAWRTLRDTPARQARLDEQWQAMQRLADEARGLRSAQKVAPAQAAAALDAATARLGAQGRLQRQADRAVLTLQGASTSQLRGWLAEARSGARARPVEATLTRQGDTYSGSIVVLLPNPS
jgi:general secretion pathway protein M